MSEQSGFWPFAPWFNVTAPNNLAQSILPDWSLQRIEVNYAGNPAIEKEVVTKVASYGKQLGAIVEAVLALAGDAPAERDKRLDRLREIAAKVETIKQEHKGDLAADARRAMESLARTDPAAAGRLAAGYAKRSTSAA